MNEDLRDRQKVVTLPSDLKEEAEKLLQDKFNLPVRGEVVQESPKGQDVGGTTVAKATLTAPVFPSDPEGTEPWTFEGNTISEYPISSGVYPTGIIQSKKMMIDTVQLSEISQMIRSHRSVTRDSCDPLEWIEYYVFNRESIVDRIEYTIPIDLVGMYTDNRYREMFPREVFEDADNRYRIEYLKRIIEHKSREILEPLILIDPRHYH